MSEVYVAGPDSHRRQGTMDGVPCTPWRNLRVCEVIDASTVWVREVPSQTCSEELLQFLEMEKSMNHHFSSNISSQYTTDHASFVKVGNPIVVCYNGCWTRGKIEELPKSSMEKTGVFLLDYGISIAAEAQTIIPLTDVKWASVPYQARKICLFGVTPVSLQYSFVNQNVKLVLKHSKHWDPSATEYVRLLSSKTPQGEFTPVFFSQKGCLYGKLLLILPKESWSSIIPESSKSHWVQREDNQMAIDLAQLLVDCEFAELWKDEGNSGSSFDSDHTYLSKGQFSGYSLPSQNSETSGDILNQKYMREPSRETINELSSTSYEDDEVGVVVSDETPTNLSRKLRPPTTKETTHSNVYLKADTKKQAENGCIGRSQKKTIELESISSDMSSSNENLNLRLTNKCGNLSSSGVTCPLLKGLSTEHLGLSRNIFSPFLLKQKYHLDFSQCEGNIKMPEDESIKHEMCNKEVNQNEGRSKLVDELSKDMQKGYISEKNEENNIMDTEKSFNPMAEDYITSRDKNESTEKSNLTNIPQWVCTSLVGAVCDPEPAVPRSYSLKDINLPERKNVELNEGNKVSTNTDIADSIKNLRQKKQMLATTKEKGEIKNPEYYNTSMSTDKMCHISNKQEFREVLTKHHTTTMKQYSLSISKTVRTYRVFMAGGHRILDEEVVINKDVLHTTLNSHIAKVLCKKGMSATRVQAYSWPALVRGCSAIIVGEKSCGKTLGYVVPLLSTLLDTHRHMSHRLPPGIGPLMVIVFSTWQSARCVADHIDSLLPANTTLKTVTAWGGCGAEEEIRTEKQLLGGCDILLTTASYFIRLLTGNSTSQAGDTKGAITTLSRCCHLVIDEADIVLGNFLSEVKQIITMWGEERKKCARLDLDLQAVLVSSKWTKSLSQLTHILLPLLDPTIIISSPFEAAIASKVDSHIHYVNDETETYGMVIDLIASSYSQKKNMVFVKSDSDADMLGSLMKSVAIYCIVTKSTVCTDKLQQLVHEWHLMQGVTMIVSEESEASLLCYDLSNAQTIFHTHFGSSWTTFSHRYGFMVDNFVTNVEKKSVNCESYIIVPQFSLANIPKVWNELSRICGIAAEELKVNLLSTHVGLSEDTAICYYLKAFGSCFEEYSCKCRHEFHFSDISHNLPKAGKVKFEVMKVLNATQYLVRLTEYKEKSDGQIIDLSNHYHIMKSALHQHYADTSHHQPLSYVEKGTLCAVKDSGHWSRAKVVSVDYSKVTTLLEVFLIDEGKNITLNMSSALFLPLHLAKVPQLIVEVFLCCIQPLDQNRQWTPQATNSICEVFSKDKKSRFVGLIALVLGHTMWLNPVLEFSKIGKKYIQKKSLRGKLLSERFGMDNPNHVRNLEDLCSLANLPSRHENVLSQGWIEALNESLQEMQIAGDTDDLDTDTLTHDKTPTELDETVQNKDSIIGDVLHSEDNCLNTLQIRETKIYSHLEEGKSMMISAGSSLASPILAHEELPLDTEVRVHVAEVVSPEEFYVIREDRLKELDTLEAEIDSIQDFLEFCEDERKFGHHSSVKSSEFKPSLGDWCIAKFTDNKYYRGQVAGGDPNGTMLIFFTDYGERIEVPSSQIHACPSVWVECLQAQAIRCSLAHLSIPPSLMQAAAQAMLHLADNTNSWTVKALQVKNEDRLLYVVEMKDSASNPQVEMYKELIHQGLALIDTTMMSLDGEETSVFLNACNIDNKEIEDFFLGLSAVHQDKIKKAKREKPEVHMKSKTTDMETEQKDNIFPYTTNISEADHSYEPVKQNKTHNPVESSKQSKDVNPSDKYEYSESISGALDPLPNKKKEGKLCSGKVNHNRQDKWLVSEKNKDWKYKENILDVNVVQTSRRNLCDRKLIRVPPLSAVEGITQKLFPETSWSQKKDTVHVTIHLVGVEQYQCCVKPSHLIFKSTLRDKFYVLDEELSNEVIADSSVASIQGMHVSITLKKATEGKWMSLFKDNRHRPWLRGDFDKLSSGNSSETENDDDEWREYFINKKIPMGGLPAGISDSEEITDTDDAENFD